MSQTQADEKPKVTIYFQLPGQDRMLRILSRERPDHLAGIAVSLKATATLEKAINKICVR